MSAKTGKHVKTGSHVESGKHIKNAEPASKTAVWSSQSTPSAAHARRSLTSNELRR